MMQCDHPPGERGRIMSVSGPVNICTWCMTRMPADDEPDSTIGQGIRLEDVRDRTAGDLGIVGDEGVYRGPDPADEDDDYEQGPIDESPAQRLGGGL